jgi:cation diffusion facilitator family transporter
MSAPDSKKVVIAALAGNLAIAACKFVAAYASESTATLAEAVHSVADTGNQALLLVGMRLAMRPATEKFPFGRNAERYFWPFIVALLLFSVGGAFALFEGISHLAHPSDEKHSPFWSYAVLGVSIIFESMSFRVAFKEFKLMAKGRKWGRVILEARDPTIPLVMAEDVTALIGLVIAFIAVGLSHITGKPYFDPIGSLFIGVLLAAVAFMLAWVTHGLLIGASASPEDQGRVLALTEATPGVDRVTQLLTMHVGPDVVILALKIAFKHGITLADLEDATNQIEKNIRGELPHMRKIFIEADSKGDGRGLVTAKAALVANEGGE